MNISSYKKTCALFLTGTIIISGLSYSGQVLANDEKQNREQQLMEWDKAGIDINYTEEIEGIHRYVSNKLEPGTFASLHIDREEHLSGVIVLSFTNELTAEMKDEIRALVEKPEKVEFRVVKYTEDQLMKKQQEIDIAIFENEVFKDEGISVYHTSSDIINNKVEVGISPFNDTTTQLILDQFGDEMVTVVEGQQMELQTTQNSPPVIDGEDHTVTTLNIEDEGKQQGIFAKFWNWLVGLIN